MTTFGRRLRQLRTERGMSLRQLADRVSVSHPYLSAVEAGGRPPTTSLLGRIADALRATPEERAELAKLAADGRMEPLTRAVIEWHRGEPGAEDRLHEMARDLVGAGEG